MGERTTLTNSSGAVWTGAWFTVVGVALLAAAGPLGGQTLQGRVLDGASRTPLADARLTLLDPDGSARGVAVTTGEDGVFSVSVPGPGEYYLRAERLSYRPLVDGVFEFSGPDGRLEVSVYLLPSPLPVGGVDVRVAASERRLRAAGFYQRAARGLGDFIGPEEVARRRPQSVSDLMRRVPGLRIFESLVFFKDAASRLEDEDREPLYACEPNVWVNGVQMARVTGPGDERLRKGDYGRGLDGYLNPMDILAIEVYRRASSTPLQWGGLNGSCGAIVIWTR